MKVRNHYFQLTTLAAALLSAYGSSALAEGDDINEYTKPDSSISVGIGNWSKDRMHEGMYDGMRDRGSYGSVDADIVMRNDVTGTWTNLTARNLGLDSVEVGGNYEKQGDWGVSFGYSQTPRYNPVVINTGLRGIGSERQTVTAVTAGTGSDRKLEMQRDATSLGLFKNFMENWEFRVNFKNEKKEGDRQWGVRTYPTLGASGGSYPAFVAEPIDSTTRQLDATISYAGEKLQVTGGYYGSWYNNHNQRLDVIGTAAGVTEMSLPPDNQAHQTYVQGSYRFTPTTRGTFRVAYTRATQDDAFMPTMNNNIASWAPKATVGQNLDGEVRTKDVMLGVTSSPMKNLSLVAKLNYWDRDDQTPVRVDASNAGNTVFYHNNPFGHTKTSALMEGTYRFGNAYSVTAGLDYNHQKRDTHDSIVNTVELFVPYRNTVKETTYRLGVRRGLTDSLNGSVGYSHSKRTGSSYLAASAVVDSATITPFYVANRDRDKWKLALDWNPTETFGLQFSFTDSRDEYPTDGARVDGIRKGEAQLWSLDATYALNDDWQFNAWYSFDTNKIHQDGPTATANWVANIDDEADTFGFGTKGHLTGKLDVGFNFDWTMSHTDYKQTTASPQLPSIENRISRATLYGTYTVDKRSTVRVDLIREDWETDDWSWAFRNGTSFSYATEGTRVINERGQAATFAGVRYIYKFQ